jgi:MFS family permease
MALVAAGALLTIGSALPIVLAGVVLFGVGMPWIVVAAITLLQRLTPAALQGRAYSAADLLLGAPQTASIAVGAALVSAVGYRSLLAVQAAVVAVAAGYLLTRGSGEQVLRGARELEDDAGLGLGRRRGALRLGEDGPHAVERLAEQRGGRDVGDLHAGGIGRAPGGPEPSGAMLDEMVESATPADSTI